MKTNSLKSLFTWGMITTTSLLALFFITYNLLLIFYPYPLEAAEALAPITTSYIMEGKSPYSLINQPLVTNVYGIVYHVVAVPFILACKSSFIAHRLLSAINIVGICFWLVYLLYKKQTKVSFCFVAGIFTYATLLHGLNPTSRPDSLGLLLFISCIGIAYLYHFTIKGLAITIVLAILAFYTKPYFILAIPFIGSYVILFVSKRRGFLYFLFSGLCFIITAIVVNHYFEFYFAHTLIVNMNATSNSIKHLLSNSRGYFIIYQFGLTVSLIILIVYYLKYPIKIKKKSPNSIAIINLCGKFEKPFININFDFFIYIFLSSLLILLYMGQHSGSMYNYFFHLLTPVWVIIVFSHLKSYQNKKFIQLSLFFFIINLILFAFIYSYKLTTYSKIKSQWQIFYTHLDKYQHMLHGHFATYYLLTHNKPVYYSGTTSYFELGIPKQKILKFIFPSYQSIPQIDKNYKTKLKNIVKEKDFDLIVTNSYGGLLVSEDFVKEYYMKSNAIELDTFHNVGKFNIFFWQPRVGNDENIKP